MKQDTRETMKKFEAYLDQNDYAASTRTGYLTDVRLFCQWFEQTNGEGVLPQRITPSDLKEYRQYSLMTKRYKANTINRKLASISVLMEWAKKSGLIEHNPVAEVKGVKQQGRDIRYLNKKEQYALQRAIEKELQIAQLRYPKRWLTTRRDASIIIFLLNTGLRLSETHRSRLQDFELTERKGKVSVIGKGHKHRNVPLNQNARKAIQSWLEVRPTHEGNNYLWIAVEHEVVGALSNRSIQRVVRRVGEEAGLADLTPHMLRHTFAKNLVNQGVGLEKVAALLGHESLDTTRLYITPDTKDLEQAVETITREN